MKRLLILLAFIFFTLGNISAIKINEIEINPQDGKEWAEIYNDENEDIDISFWEIYDGLTSEKKRYTFPEGTTLESKDYIIAEFSSSVLNNAGDYLILYDSNKNEIDKTDELKEQTAKNETWQYCRGDGWIFKESTKNKENECENEEEKETIEIIDESLPGEEIKETSTKNPITFQTINLETKTIKSTLDNKEISKNYSVYGIIGFLMLIVFLFILRKQRYKKNEFN